MATFTLVSEPDFTVLSGETKGFTYPKNTESCAGNGLTPRLLRRQRFPVFTNELADLQGGVFIQEATLDQISEWFAPEAEIYTWNCRPWIPALDVLQYDHEVAAAADSPSRTRANPPWLRCWRRRGHGTIAERPRRRAPGRARRGGRRGRR